MNKLIAIFIFFSLNIIANAQTATEEEKSEWYFYSLPGNNFEGYTRYNGSHFYLQEGENERIYNLVKGVYNGFWSSPSELEVVTFSFDNLGNVLNVKLASQSQKDKGIAYDFLSNLMDSASISIDQNLIDNEFKDLSFYITYNFPVKP